MMNVTEHIGLLIKNYFFASCMNFFCLFHKPLTVSFCVVVYSVGYSAANKEKKKKRKFYESKRKKRRVDNSSKKIKY